MAAVTQGTLTTRLGKALPLSHTEVRAKLFGPLAEVEVEQRFENQTGDAIEAVYTFPLPSEASVFFMQFRIADRVVKAVVKDKAAARADYERARAQGRAASLLEEDAPSVFTLSVANVPKGASVDVELRYQQLIEFDDGQWRFVFPMVAPARYHELASQADALSAPRRLSEERARDVRLSLEVRAAGLDRLRCPSHAVHIERDPQNDPDGVGRAVVKLDDAQGLPNRDFVLTFEASAQGVRPMLRFDRSAGEDGTFLLLLTPPASTPQEVSEGLASLKCSNCGAAVTDLSKVQQIPGLGAVFSCSYCGAVLTPGPQRAVKASRPRDVIVMVDRSASMQDSLPQAQRAVRALLSALPQGDAIQVMAFDHEREFFDEDGRSFVAVAPEVTQKVDRFLSKLQPRGGTDLLEALKRAAQLPVRDQRSASVVLITDGALGNEGRLLREAKAALGGQRRLFVLGLGPAVDRRLVRRLAGECQGAADVLNPQEDVEPVMNRFARRVVEGGPVLTGLSLSWEDAGVEKIYPASIPDLFGGQPVRLIGRYTGSGAHRLVLTGATADGAPFRQELAVELPARTEPSQELACPGLTRVWAQRRVEALTERLDEAPGNKLEEEITKLALEHQIVSRMTSLVAEDSEVSVEPPSDLRAQAAQQEMRPGASIDDLDAEPAMRAAAIASSARPMMPPVAMDAAFGGAPSGAPPSAMAEGVAELPSAPSPMLGGPPPSAPRGKARSGGVLKAAGGLFKRILGGASESPPSESTSSFDSWGAEAKSESGYGSPPPPPPPSVRGRPGAAAWEQSTQRQPLNAPGSESYEEEELRWLNTKDTGALDLVFLIDATGSMGPYIEQVKLRLLDLVHALQQAPLCRCLRLGLVEYRDHPPQDHTFITRVTELTEDVQTVQKAALQMEASGGGDGPEAVTAGLFDVVRLGWRPGAAKTVVWFGDAPPHGVEPRGDGFPGGCPTGNHWYTQAESCREMGVAVYAIGCLPGIQHFEGALPVFQTVAKTSRGSYLPLGQASLLIPLIAGAAQVELDKQRVDERLAEVIAAHEEALARTDEAERVRWLTEVMRQKNVRPRVMEEGAGPLRFRTIAPEDVEASLGRLRVSQRGII